MTKMWLGFNSSMATKRTDNSTISYQNLAPKTASTRINVCTLTATRVAEGTGKIPRNRGSPTFCPPRSRRRFLKSSLSPIGKFPEIFSRGNSRYHVRQIMDCNKKFTIYWQTFVQPYRCFIITFCPLPNLA